MKEQSRPATKVLVVTAAFPPMKAGEADHAYHICSQLGQRGIDVHVLTTEGSRVSERLPFITHANMRDWSWRDLPRFARFVKECAPDVVLLIYIGWIYGDHPMMTFAPTVVRAVLPQCRVVTQFEYPMGCNNDKFSVVTRVVRRLVAGWASPHGTDYAFGTLLRDSDGVIVLSDSHRRMLVEQYPPVDKKVILIPPPPLLTMALHVTMAQRQQIRAKFGFADDDMVFVYFGYIYPPKGVETLLRAFHIISQDWKNVRLLLIGGVVAHEYPQRPRFAEEMRELPKRLGFDRQVVWAGEFETESDQASRYIHSADVCVFPHDLGVYLNNSSFAAVAAHGLPIVATQAPYVESPFVEGENLVFCEPKSPESMAAAMTRVLEDCELRKRLGRGAVKLASDWFSWDKATARMIEAIEGAKAIGS
jgi:polysaccharide biosynthesis protein PslF